MNPSDGHSPSSLRLCYSVADQDFARTKSLGILNLSLGLLRALAVREPQELSRLAILANSGLESRLPKPDARTSVSLHDQASGGRLGRVLWDHFGVVRAARRAGCDWLLLPKGFSPWRVPPELSVAAYVHDVIGEFYRERYPHAVSRAEATYFLASLRATLRRARVILTNTEFTRTEVLRYARRWNIRTGPVIPVGIGFAEPRPPSPKLNRVVVLSGRFPHKRTDLALAWLDRWQRDTRFAGEIHWIGGAPPKLAWPDHPRWTRHPRLDDPTYDALLESARALVYFSEYEGFGMPPIEALLRGAHPVFSRVPALLEVMGDAGFGFDNAEFPSFATALNLALAAPPESARTQALAMHHRFHWTGVADRTLGALRGAPSPMAPGPRPPG